MKVKVRKPYRDSVDGQIKRAGEELEYEYWRAQSLSDSGFVVLLETADVEEAEPVTDALKVSGSDLLAIMKNAQNDDDAIPEGNEHEEDSGTAEEDREKNESDPSPEKDEQSGPKKRGPKPKK